MASQMISPYYLILHSEHEGDLQKPWIVYRCRHDSDQQDELFRGDRPDAVAYLAAHWDDDLDRLPIRRPTLPSPQLGTDAAETVYRAWLPHIGEAQAREEARAFARRFCISIDGPLAPLPAIAEAAHAAA
jgi:hypothetical protein